MQSKYAGYMGKVIMVDLSTETISEYPWSDEQRELYLGGKIMAARRKPGGSESLKWEFPGGKVENGETPEKALERELYEELGIRTETERIYDCRIRWGEERTIVLLFYFTKLVDFYRML